MHIGFVMGTSGNVTDTNKQISISRGIIRSLKRLTSQTLAAIVTYSNNVRITKDLSPVDEVEKVLGTSINNSAAGRTLSTALKVVSRDVLKPRRVPAERSVIVFVLKDSDDAETPRVIAQLRDQGINVFVIGIGAGVDQGTIDSLVGPNGRGIVGTDKDEDVIEKEAIKSLFLSM